VTYDQSTLKGKQGGKYPVRKTGKLQGKYAVRNVGNWKEIILLGRRETGGKRPVRNMGNWRANIVFGREETGRKFPCFRAQRILKP
jgi:hypothetical protein